MAHSSESPRVNQLYSLEYLLYRLSETYMLCQGWVETCGTMTHPSDQHRGNKVPEDVLDEYHERLCRGSSVRVDDIEHNLAQRHEEEEKYDLQGGIFSLQ